MLTADAVEVYELLKPQLGEQGARSLLHFIDERTVHVVRDEIAKGLATREDIAEIREDIAEVKADIARLEMATKENIARLEMATKEVIAEVKADIARLEQATKEDIFRLEKEFLTFRAQVRLYFVALAALILITSPRVIDLVSKILGLAPGP